MPSHGGNHNVQMGLGFEPARCRTIAFSLPYWIEMQYFEDVESVKSQNMPSHSLNVSAISFEVADSELFI